MVKFSTNPVKSNNITRLDNNAESLGIPKKFLMECAGLQASNKIFEKYFSQFSNKDQKITIFCGLGNNGGDGFVIARHLSGRGIKISVYLIGDPQKIRTEESRFNWNLLQNLNLNIEIHVIKDSSQIMKFSNNLASFSLIVDSLLGTGVKGEIREPMASTIDLINSFTCPIISIDVPSGLDPNTGKSANKMIKCNYLITFHNTKVGFTHIKKSFDVEIVPIGIPVEAEIYIGDGDLQQTIPKRNIDNHKGKYGKLLVIGGSSSYSGAPFFASKAAIEFGLDLVVIFTPKSVSNVIRSYSPNLIVREGTADNFCIDDLILAKELSNWADSIVIGPGLGQNLETLAFFKELLLWQIDQKNNCILDADAIKMFGAIKNEIPKVWSESLLFTPHIKELSYLIDVKDIPNYSLVENRIVFLEKALSNKLGVFLIKGVYDFILECNSSKDWSYRVNRSGCPEMSVGGTGDVLAGLCGALNAVGNSLFLSACSASYLNGRLGEISKSKYGDRIQALDMISEIRSFLNSKKYSV